MTNTQHPVNIFIYIGFTSIISYLAIYLGINFLKYLAVFTQSIVILISVTIILKYRKSINWNITFPILSVLSIYPISRIFFSSIDSWNFKHITDGLILHGGYYYLPIVGLAIAILTHSEQFNLRVLLLNFSKLFLPVGILITINITLHQAISGGVGAAYIVFNNCLIPASLLAFLPKPRKYNYLGWISIISILYVSSLISSRSYFIVGIFIAAGALIHTVKMDKKTSFTLILICSLAYLTGASSVMTENSLVQNQSIYDKFQLDSLLISFQSFLKDGDPSSLFFWKGNSRAGILSDAFRYFTFEDYVIGKGIFATYISFVKRSVIEMNWGQEVFRWGIPYVVFSIYIYIRGYFFLRRNKYSHHDILFPILSVLVLIRLLDGFIYGDPRLSVYNLIVFWGIMLQGIKKNNTTLLHIRFRRIVPKLLVKPPRIHKDFHVKKC
jgi:hypothetical protein